MCILVRHTFCECLVKLYDAKHKNAVHFCDIIFKHRAVFPPCKRNSVRNQKSSDVRIN